MSEPASACVAHQLADWTLEALEPFGPAALECPAEWATRRGEKLPVELSFRRFAVPGVGELRWTKLLSARADIIALMIFPHDASQLPVFAAEFVLLGGRCKAAVVDLQSASDEPGLLAPQVERALGPIALEYSALRSPVLPDWCHEHFTPHAIAALGVDVVHLDNLLDGYRRYLAAYVAMALEVAPLPQRPGQFGLRHYKDHHIENTPGRPFMSAAFGPEWTERFLRGGMYA